MGDGSLQPHKQTDEAWLMRHPEYHFNECSVASVLFRVDLPGPPYTSESMSTEHIDNIQECTRVIRKYKAPHTIIDALTILEHHVVLHKMPTMLAAETLYSFFRRLLSFNHNSHRVFQFVATLLASKMPLNYNVSPSGRFYIKTVSTHDLTCTIICPAATHLALDMRNMLHFTCMMDQANPCLDHASTVINGLSIYGRVVACHNFDLFERMVVEYHFFPYFAFTRVEDNPMLSFSAAEVGRLMSLLSLPDRQLILMECTMCISILCDPRLTRRLMQYYMEGVGVEREREMEICLCAGLDYISLATDIMTIDMLTPIHHRLRCFVLHTANLSKLHIASDYLDRYTRLLVNHLEELIKEVMVGIPATLSFGSFMPPENLKHAAMNFRTVGVKGFVMAWFTYCRHLNMAEEDTVNIALCVCMWHLYHQPGDHDEYLLSVAWSLVTICSSDELCTLKRLFNGIYEVIEYRCNLALTEKEVLMMHALILSDPTPCYPHTGGGCLLSKSEMSLRDREKVHPGCLRTASSDFPQTLESLPARN